MKRIAALTTTLMLTLSGASARADWASGGGEILKDGQNPWFLQNTETVKTCLVVDPDHFHTPRGDIAALETRFDEALAYWQAEFKNSFVVGNVMQVASQRFVSAGIVVKGKGAKGAGTLGACPADTDLTVQLGWLSPDQVDYFNKYLGGPTKYLGATIRTSYDRVNMRGRGFIYVAADSGPLKFDAAGLVADPWSLGQGYLITAALKHELGHVFGLPHKSMRTVMAADYLEMLLDPRLAPYYASNLDERPFFKLAGHQILRQQCRDGQSGRLRTGWVNFLQIPAAHHCYEVTLDGDRMLFASGPSLETLEPRGTLKFTSPETFTWEEAVRVYLPDEQSVITRIPSGAGAKPWLLGPMIKNTERAGTYVSTDGTTQRQVFVTLVPMGIGFAQSVFRVEMGGTWHWNLDFEY